MGSNHKRAGECRGVESQDKDWPEKMKLSLAAKYLGISTSNLSNLVGSGKIVTEGDPLDRRVRLVKRSDLEKLLRQRNRV